MKYLISCLAALFIYSTGAVCQSGKTSGKATEILPVQLKLIAKNRGREISLRWAFSEPEAWMYLSSHGFWLERFELDDATNEPISTTPLILSGHKIYPWREEEFKANISERDTFLAIAGQCLYGDDLTGNDPNNSMFRQMELKSKSDENRFLFAMLAASMDSKASQSLGWGYTDQDIKPGLKYIYRLRVDDDLKNRFRTDTSYYVIATDEIFPNDVPMTPILTMGDSIAILEWYRSPNYIAYFVERSEDGISWKRLTDKPFLNMTNANQNDSKKIVYSDVLSTNFKEYHYRIIGLDIFGDESPASDPVSGSGRDLTPTTPPKLYYAKNTEGLKVTLKWDIDQKSDLRGFWVKRGYSMEGPWTTIHSKPLPPNTREYVDAEAEEFGLNFYRVYSIDDHGNENGSYPVYAQIYNQAPPAKPIGLHGTIDTTGMLTLRWNANKEPDLMGYELYYANQEDHFFIVMNDSILTDTFFQTKISLKNLTKNIFFKIRAIDFHHSLSEFSDVLKLKKPDLIPPTRPIFTDYLANDSGITLSWVGSSSNDVKYYRLERSEEKTGWKILATLDTETTKYTDQQVKPGLKYHYRIIAIDEAGLESTDPSKLAVMSSKIRKRPDIKKLDAKILANNEGVELRWDYEDDPQKVQFIVFQVLENGSLRQLAKTDGSEKIYKDNTVAKAGKTVMYAVKAEHKEGGSSNLAKTKYIFVN